MPHDPSLDGVATTIDSKPQLSSTSSSSASPPALEANSASSSPNSPADALPIHPNVNDLADGNAQFSAVSRESSPFQAPITPQEVTQATLDDTGTFPAMLRATGALVPTVLLLMSAFASLFAYQVYPGTPAASSSASLFAATGWPPLVWGLILTLTLWLVGSAVFSTSSSVTRASFSSYLAARDKLSDLATKLRTTDELAISPAPRHDQALKGFVLDKYDDALTLRAAAVRVLTKRGVVWVTGAGYIELWSALYRADEATLLCLPLDEVTAEAVSDTQRLQGSQIPTRDALLDRLCRAIVQLGPDAQAKLAMLPAGAGNLTPDESGARQAIRAVRQELNDFVAQRFAGIIAARNLLLQIGIGLGLVAYVIFLLVMLGQSSEGLILALTAFYLIGGGMGFLNLFIAHLTKDTLMEDYGRSHTRMYLMPSLAGLAAIAGVFLAHVVGAPLAGLPSPENDIASVFALTTHNALLAAVFGWTPQLVVSVLQLQSDRYLKEIKSTLETQDGTK